MPVAVAKAEKTSGAGVNGGALVLQDHLQVPNGMAATAGAVPSASIRINSPSLWKISMVISGALKRAVRT
ncbi:MAG: hypothetical protein K2Y51_00595 [Gammaproteobacteria bacterium]|nr:hypothetical protein [Gammaproteobacteria bacterium]